jgi:hypothetical protein
VSATVLLRGGPHDGKRVPAPPRGVTLNIFEDGAPDPGAECARYRPAREPGVYSYRGQSKLAAVLPQPGGARA